MLGVKTGGAMTAGAAQGVDRQVGAIVCSQSRTR